MKISNYFSMMTAGKSARVLYTRYSKKANVIHFFETGR